VDSQRTFFIGNARFQIRQRTREITNLILRFLVLEYDKEVPLATVVFPFVGGKSLERVYASESIHGSQDL
jgi:hypothetical protein